MKLWRYNNDDVCSFDHHLSDVLRGGDHYILLSHLECLSLTMIQMPNEFFSILNANSV